MARTSFSNIARTFKPNTASLGYALFLAINAAGVWGGVFPFLPMNFQTPEVMFWFFLMQSLVFSLCYLASAVGVYYFPGPTRRFMVMLASAPYLLGWCCLIGAIYLHGVAQALVIAGGSLLGLGSAGFYMLWQRLFASFDADHGNHDLILGTAYGALLYFALYAIPQAVTAFLIPLVFMPLFALAIVLKSRQIDLRQPMFEDVPREHPQVYRRVLRDYWRSALCVGAIAFCTGVMRSLAIGDPRVGSLVNLLSMTGCLVAGVGVLVLWQFKNVRMNVTNAYRIAFPLLITSFLVLPFCSGGYARWQAAILYAVYSVAIALTMIQCAQASRDRGINPIFIYGFFAGIVYALHDVGFLAGTFAEQIRVIGIQPDAVVALVAVYLLGLMFFIGQGGFKRALAASQAEDIELVAGAPLQIGNINERQTDLDEAEPESEALSAANAGCASTGVCPLRRAGSLSVRNETHRHRAYGKRRSHGNRRIRKPPWQRDLSRRHRKTKPSARRRCTQLSGPPIEAGGTGSAALPPIRTRDRGHGAYRPRQYRGAHRRAAGGFGKHHPNPQQAHLRQAGYP